MKVAARLAAAIALCAAGLQPAASQPEPPPSLVRVDLRAMTTAIVPGETETLVVRARAVNTSAEPIVRLRLSLRFGQPLRGRSDIASGTPIARGSRVDDKPLGDGELVPAGTADANFDVSVEDLPFRDSRTHAVYPMRIEIRARGVVVGAADTYVMWWPPQGSPRVRMAWVWPLVERSHRGVGNDFYDDDLADSVGDGRLETLLRVGAGAKVPVTWAVDPELVDSLRRMATGYTVRGRDGERGTVARTWVERLRNALRGESVLPLPYADPDLAATATGPLAADATRAFQLGQEILRRDLDNAGDARLAWPPGETFDTDVESLLAGQGVKAVVVPQRALPLTETLYYTPTAPAPLASGALGRATALVVDEQLAGVAGGTGAEGPRLQVQRFLADSAMISLERPNDTRDVVVAPPRTWAPVTDFAFQLLEQTASAPWIQPVGLGDVLSGEPSTAARTLTPAGPGILPAEQVRRVVEARKALQRVRGILTDPSRSADDLAELDDALLRAVSAQWGADPAGGRRLTDSVTARVGAQLSRIRIVPGGVITMTGRSGRIPLTFQNDLGQTVRVRVRLETGGRLALKDTGWERGQEVPVPPGGSTVVIEGKATTGGLFPIKVALLAQDGSLISETPDLRVRSTAWGAVALGVTAGAFALLLVGSATRLMQRRRRAKVA